MSSLLLRQREQRDVFTFEARDLNSGHHHGRASVHRIDDGHSFQVACGHQPAHGAVVHLHPVLERDGGEASMVGPTHQRADFLDVDQDGHVATLGGEPPFSDELAVQDQPDDFLAHAESELCGLGDSDLAGSGHLQVLGAVEQSIEEGVQIFGSKLVSGPVVRPADPGDDQPRPVQPVPLDSGRVEIFAGLADRERGCGGVSCR